MPLFANVEGRAVRPGQPEPSRATCTECSADMIAKRGRIVVWHWAHVKQNSSCPYASESMWHLGWKSRGIEGTQEIWRHDFSRRADIYSPAGLAIEFQHSRLSRLDVIQRERDWEHRLVWIFDCRSDMRTGLLEFGPDAAIYHKPPPMLLAAIRPWRWSGWGCRVFLDTGRGWLWYAQYQEREHDWQARFYGFPVTEEAVVENVLRARSATALAAMSLRMDLWLPDNPRITQDN